MVYWCWSKTWDEVWTIIFMLNTIKMVVPLSGAPPPRKNHGSAPPLWYVTSIATESPSNRKFGTRHDFLPISQYFSQLQVQSVTFFVFWGLASLLCFLIFFFFIFISVHLPLWLLVVCNSTHYTMLIKTLQTTSLHDLYFVYLIWNSSFVKVNRHLHSLLSLNQNLTLIHVLIPPNLTIQVLAS